MYGTTHILNFYSSLLLTYNVQINKAFIGILCIISYVYMWRSDLSFVFINWSSSIPLSISAMVVVCSVFALNLLLLYGFVVSCTLSMQLSKAL